MDRAKGTHRKYEGFVLQINAYRGHPPQERHQTGGEQSNLATLSPVSQCWHMNRVARMAGYRLCSGPTHPGCTGDSTVKHPTCHLQRPHSPIHQCPQNKQGPFHSERNSVLDRTMTSYIHMLKPYTTRI